jgi:hypothetical protein
MQSIVVSMPGFARRPASMDDTGLSTSSQPKLTLEAKQAVRGYILLLVIPTGVVLATLTFFAGLLVESRGTEKAISAALQIASKELVTLARDAGRHLKDTENARDGAIKLQEAFDAQKRLLDQRQLILGEELKKLEEERSKLEAERKRIAELAVVQQ